MKATKPMKNFIGTKMLKATPMNRLAYNEYREWILPPNEDGSDEGYLVEYTDGGKPNDPRHKGYISWSPKEQFDAAYVEAVGVSDTNEPWVNRVNGELALLLNNTIKLTKFLLSPTAELLDPGMRNDMHRQTLAMREYASVLQSLLNRAL